MWRKVTVWDDWWRIRRIINFAQSVTLRHNSRVRQATSCVVTSSHFVTSHDVMWRKNSSIIVRWRKNNKWCYFVVLLIMVYHFWIILVTDRLIKKLIIHDSVNLSFQIKNKEKPAILMMKCISFLLNFTIGFILKPTKERKILNLEN